MFILIEIGIKKYFKFLLLSTLLYYKKYYHNSFEQNNP